MTDEQIIKAVGICRTPGTCRCCPYHELYTTWCVCALMKDVFDLINRQKAEIEVLEKGLTEYKLRLKMSECTVDEIKSEAIKDFAERLKRKIWHSGWCNLERTITPEIITNLVKEMMEEQK